MTTPKPPALTDRARARVAAGAEDGAGTDTCAKCGGVKEPHRLNSDRCAACNGRASDPPVTTRKPSGRAVRHAVKFDADPDMMEVMVREATARNMTLSEYVHASMLRVLRKDAHWTPSA